MMSPLSILALAIPAAVIFALLQSPAVAGRQFLFFSASDSPWTPSDNRTLVSANRTFSAGFAHRSSACGSSSPSGDQYAFSVWVTSDHSAGRTVVWSFDCNSNNTNLTLDATGVLSLNGKVKANSGDKVMTLEDNGELKVGNWTSFDFPTHTILPGQGFRGTDLTSRNGRYQFVNATTLTFNHTDGYWNVNSPLMNLTTKGYLNKESGDPIVASDIEEVRLRRLTLDDDGNLRIYSLVPKTGNWTVVWQLVTEACKIHGTCGRNSLCFNNGSTLDTTCVCLPGFKWMPGGGSCERKTGEFLQNSKFLSLDFVDFPDFPGTPKLDESTRSFDDCQRLCLQNTSCSAFTYKYTGERKCTHRGEPLVNLFWSPATETRTFLRVAAGEKDRSNFTGMFSVLETVCPVRIQLPDPPKESKTTARNLGIIGTAFGLELLAGILSFWAFLRRYSQYRDMARALGLEFLPAGGPKRFTYAELKAATKDFSDEVGSGGFGVVYKGELPDRRVVAVKRLKDAAGSEADFWAEANIIARMHHLNLVRLWGFCAEKGQRMLVYEFIPNGSLDKYIFPPSPRRQRGGGGEEEEELEGEEKTRKPLLDWNIRYRIAVGVARAIAYLHEECLEWVLHRDIKPENILLDGDFCPKVSDFGMAKLTKEDRFSRSGVKGTQGYMAPEWVMPREPITAKADVYSFGMVLLEMVTGARNNKFQMSALQSEEWYFPVFAYEKVYVERRVEDIIDPRILDSYDSRAHLAMVDRMLKTAIWCLQERPEMRPSMGKVAKMLEGSVEITEPGKPTIFYLRDT